MNVFHGSYTKIEEIDLSKSQPNKDFGQVFYVTKFRRHAEIWAKVIGQKHHTEGVVTEFIYYNSSFTERLMEDFKLNEMEAADNFYTSTTFQQLADITTNFYLKTWQEIYEMLKIELETIKK
jgi:hypothetical protein